MGLCYSIIKDSSVDLGVNFKIVQNQPTIKAVSIKICLFGNILIFLRENKEVSFLIFWIFKLKQPFLNRTINDYGPFLDFLTY
jgi:hypothetical protein